MVWYCSMKEYLEEVLSIVRKQVCAHECTVVFLEAGHFKLNTNVETFSTQSLEDAVCLGKYLINTFKKQVRVVFGILVDDLGQECGIDKCSVSVLTNNDQTAVDRAIPKPLLDILKQEQRYVKLDRVLLFSEKTAKNRSIKHLKNAISSYATNVITEGEQGDVDVYCANQPYGRILLAKKKDKTFNAYCPSIMGQHYADVFAKLAERFFERSCFITIDWSEMMDNSKVLSGTQAFKRVFCNTPSKKMTLTIINIFFADDKGKFYQIDETAVVQDISKVEELQ